MKQYAFYRMSDGNPYKEKDSKYTPNAILAEIGSASKLNSKGQAMLDEFLPYILLESLSAAITIIGEDCSELNDNDISRIVKDGIVAIVKNKPGNVIAGDEFLKTVNRLAADHFRKNKKKFVLISSLAISKFPATKIKIGGCLISSLKRRGKKYPLPALLSSKYMESVDNKNGNYTLIKVITEGRSTYEAAERAINALSILRALWSLYSSFGRVSRRIGYDSSKPIGSIHAGKYHTLHNKDGSLAKENTYWYEENDIIIDSLFDPSGGWEDIEKFRKRATRKMMKLPYLKEMQELLIRYTDALDQLNMDMAFLKMWSLLENITNTVGGKYNETIKRTIWPFSGKEKNIAKNLLEILRCNRNRCVHTGRTESNNQPSAELVKSILDPHIFGLLFNLYKIDKLKEYGDILSLPSGLNEIKSRISLYRKVERIQSLSI